MRWQIAFQTKNKYNRAIVELRGTKKDVLLGGGFDMFPNTVQEETVPRLIKV